MPRQLMTTVTLPGQPPVTIPTDAVASFMNTKFYNGPVSRKVLPHLKEGYKGKNWNGGRKCRMTQSKAYRDAEKKGTLIIR